MILMHHSYPLSRLMGSLALSGLISVIAIPTALASQKKSSSTHHAADSHKKPAESSHLSNKQPNKKHPSPPLARNEQPSDHPAHALSTAWGMIAEPQFPTAVCQELSAVLTPNSNRSIDALDRDSSRSSIDTSRIQQSIDACPEGQAVKLVTGPQGESGFLSGPLKLKSHVTLWIDSGVTLYASRNPRDYDEGSGTCGTADHTKGKACRPLLSADRTEGSAIMGFGAIDGRGGSLLTDGQNRMKHSWWDLAHLTKTQGLIQHNPRLLEITASKDFTLYQISFLNTPNFTTMFTSSQGMTAWGIKMLAPSSEYTVADYACPSGSTPEKSATATCFTPDTISNTDGFDTQNASRVLLAYSYISTGDDHVSVKSSENGPVSEHLAFIHNHFFYGHGMSIGSETVSGVHHMVVDDLSIDGNNSPNSNGLRIKSDASRGGSVSDVSYNNVCMRNLHHPIVLDSYYSKEEGSKFPSFTDIHFNGIHDLGVSGSEHEINVFSGYSTAKVNNPLDISLNNVVFDGQQPVFTPETLRAARLHLGPGPVSFTSALETMRSGHIQVDSSFGKAEVVPVDCHDAFVRYNSILPSAPF